MSSGSMPAVLMARIAATAAIDAVVSWAAATRRSRVPLDERLLRLDQGTALGDDPHHATREVGLDLVEQLHGLDQADHLADRDLATGLDVGSRPRRRGGVEDPRQWRLDGRPPGDGRISTDRGRFA